MEISKIGIVGAGTMGTRIAFRCAASDLETRLFDGYPAALDKATERLSGWLSQRVGDGRLSLAQAQAIRGRLRPCRSLQECVADADLVIETVPEILELKRQVLAEVDELAQADTLIATNSSSIPCSRLADATARPDKVFNINFSDPTHDELVELMKGPQTSLSTMAAGEAFVRSLGMVPIVTWKEIMGFTFNRIWRAIKRETLHLVAEGYSDFEDIDRAWMLEFGTPWGPCGLMDKIGLDVIRDVERQYYLESGDERDRPPPFLEEWVSSGHLGVKTGRGFYTYPDPAYEQAGWLRKQLPWTPAQTLRP
jgi:3-hydroxybutyryl-CoA dehydrogenase